MADRSNLTRHARDRLTARDIPWGVIDLILAYPRANGPADIDLTLRPAGEPIRLTGTLADPVALAGSAVSDVTLDIKAPGATGRFDGRVSLRPEVQGMIALDSSDTATLARALGRRAPDFRDAPVHEVLDPPGQLDLGAVIAELSVGSGVTRQRLRLRGAAGREVHADAAWMLLHDHDGRPEGLMLSAWDVTRDMRRAELLDRTRDHHSLVIEANRIGIFEVDVATGEVHCDALAEEALGYGPGEMDGTPLRVLRRRHRLLRLSRAEAAALSGRGPLAPLARGAGLDQRPGVRAGRRQMSIYCEKTDRRDPHLCRFAPPAGRRPAASP